MSLMNEIAKLRESAGTGGGSSLGNYSTPNLTDPVIAQRQIVAGSSNHTSGNAYPQSSSSYKRVFNHGGGQYSVCSRHYTSGGINSAEVYVQPFTVNQTTGAITVGSGAQIFNGSSSIDTGTWAQAGNYVMTQHTSASNGNGASAGTVSGNSVSGAATYFSQPSNMQPMSNNDAASFRSGSTMYMYPQNYNTSDGRARRLTLSYNGSSISLSEGPTDFGSNTSTYYSYPVAPQHGQTSPTTGAGLRNWTSNSPSGLTYLEILNTSGSYSSTVNPQTLGVLQQSSPYEGFGLELSNGRQLFYADGGLIFLLSGGTLSNVTGSADYIPKSFNNQIGLLASGGAADTWISLSPEPNREIVKFSINPTTYKVTILGSVPLNKYIKGGWPVYDNGGHVSMTGSSNQFIVIGRTAEGTGGAIIQVITNPFIV
jgi:hypothetical protein